jgi:predicted DNA binding protein/CheY-like chemotaxis protein/GAF domain-containing protein
MTDANPPHVLLIEDNPGDARLVEELLAEGAAWSGGGDGAGTPTVSQVDGLTEGLERVDDDAIDVVLLDLGLPESTGLSTLETVRERTATLPIVVLTGLDDETVGDRAVQEGAQEYLQKDELTPQHLRRSIQHAIDRKEFERTQVALHAASRDLIGAESRIEASRRAVEAAGEVFEDAPGAGHEAPAAGVYLFDDSRNVLAPAAHTDALDAVLGDVPSFEPGDERAPWQAFVRGETLVVDDVRESDALHAEDSPVRSGVWIPLGGHGVLAVVSDEVGRFDQRTARLADHLAATVEATLDRVEREESLREQERELAARNRQLESLDRTNELIREIDQALVQATTREAIERAVCDLLTSADRFAFAWIGESADDGVHPRVNGGADQGYLEAVSLSTDAQSPPPSVSTLRTGDETVASNVAADLGGAPWRKAALARDLQSAISVPLTYNGVSYGVLTVFATEPGTFDDRLAAVFAELGGTIANAMNAVETRQALLTETVVELELSIRDPDNLFVRLAREAGCEVDYGGTVPQSDGTTRVFFAVRDCGADAVRAVVDDAPDVGDLQAIGGLDDDGSSARRFEATVTGPTIPLAIVECGALVRSLAVGDEAAVRVVVELLDATDVRTFVDRLEATYPDTELLARRDRERPEPDAASPRAAILERLTDRQLEALQTAYLSGYFEWPRERTGEEVAESLGITQPTLNAHLRAAERKLCRELFGGDPLPSD